MNRRIQSQALIRPMRAVALAIFLLGFAGQCKVNSDCADAGDPGCSKLLALFWLKILKPRYYYATDQSGFVLQYSVNLDTGALTAIAPKLPVTGASTITTDVNGKYAYIQNTNTTITQMKITQGSGELVDLGSQAIAATTLSGVSYDALQRFVFVSSSGGAGTIVTMRPSLSTGLLTPIQSFNPALICTNTKGVAPHPSGKFLYCGNATTIGSLVIDGNTGALSSGPSTPGVTGSIYDITFDSTGNFLFLISSTNAESYAVNQTTGTLTLRSSIALAGGVYSIVSIGNNVYAGGGGLRQFSYDPGTGVLTLIGTNASPGANPLAIAAEAQGKFVYAMNPAGGILFTFARNSDGTLTTMNPTAGVTLGGVMIAGTMSSPINQIFAADQF
ncbi:MAG: beta-propeller fold lactonase family protein [Leptospirales bacterium]|nr:beta-propeller fold lactonase family protein [Leptospirales bacterium]